jgi:hypothetical protein
VKILDYRPHRLGGGGHRDIHARTTNMGLKQISGMANLRELQRRGTKVTAIGVAALQKALPNCKIDWDDPAKPNNPVTPVQ